jgi:hypothetical protein
MVRGIGTERPRAPRCSPGRPHPQHRPDRSPDGNPLREIIEEIGGGVPDGRRFKAVQTGGPSGGCLPEQQLDLPVDYDSLREVGSIMGSGGMIVMDETSSMVDVARYFMEFCMTESCGKCVPCRVGTYQMHELLDKIAKGQATPRTWPAGRIVRGGADDQPVRAGPDGPQSGAEHAALLPARVRRETGPPDSPACGGTPREMEATIMIQPHLPPMSASSRSRSTTRPQRPRGRDDHPGGRENGIRIPSLCYLEGLSVWGACRLCVVEIAGSPRLVSPARRASPRAWRSAPTPSVCSAIAG